ncbi:MAG: carbohydrate-binding domain-containing protein [Bacilli bacterium]|nr:carbohydrate-binding domain-containing protein [Bacilli bacterium]
MKLQKLILVTASFLLMSCGGTASTSSSTAASSATATSTTTTSTTTTSTTTTSEAEATSEATTTASVDVSSLESKYGDLEITVGDSSVTGASVSYDSTNNIYTLAVCAEKAEYVVTGYATTSIVISDVNNLGEGNYKGVKLTLSNAALVSSTDDPVIEYTCSKKNVQLSVKNGTNNVIYATNGGDAVYSENNVEVSGKGSLAISSVADGHGIKAEGDITFQGSNSVTIDSGHDGLHCENLVTTDPDDSTSVYAGTVTIASAVSQGIEAATDDGDGTITLDGGNWNISNAESVFKTDTAITIASGVKVTGTNISGDAIVFGDNSTSSITLTVNGTFTVDGASYSSQTIEQ